ncbi:MAG: hypothetical protein J4F35_21440 [Candidatus Latescibacteria bacterium]|nr:hypothetical protein [Candidatus Latescibacterota bacterium]
MSLSFYSLVFSGIPWLGIDIYEEKAKNLLVGDQVRAFYVAEDRRADGSVVRP